MLLGIKEVVGTDGISCLGMFASIQSVGGVWKARNDQWVFKRKWVNEVQINAKGVEEFHEYILPSYSTVYMETMPRDHNGAHDQRWVPTNPGFLKVNVGGAFDAVSGRGGVGIVIRIE